MSNARELAELGGSYGTGGFVGMKNRIINGAMVIDQRNAGASVTPVDGQYTIDRYKFSLAQTSKLTTQQSTTAPTGFASSLLITSSSAYSVLSGDNFNVIQWIEGYNTADLAWGTASAATVTLSFWVRSSLTGTFGGSLVNNNQNYSYPFTYTISTANTFEYKTITIAGPTAGTWSNTTTTRNIGLWIGLGVGSTGSGTAGAWAAAGYYSATGATSVVGTSGATFYITGVQLEKGSTATSFDYRPYGTELALCQRYLPAVSFAGGANPYFGAGMAYSTTAAYYTVSFPVTPRVPPTGLTVSSASHFAGFLANSSTSNATGVSFSGANNHSAFVNLTGMSSLVAGNSTLIYMNNSSALMLFTGCEL
jgi:hypothetical protein